MMLIALHTTIGAEDQAKDLARAAVAQQLAACVQIEAIQSVYVWQGNVQEEPEWRLLFKTTAAKASALMQFVQKHHAYELPAIYTTEVLDATPQYRAWVQRCVEGAEQQGNLQAAPTPANPASERKT